MQDYSKFSKEQLISNLTELVKSNEQFSTDDYISKPNVYAFVGGGFVVGLLLGHFLWPKK